MREASAQIIRFDQYHPNFADMEFSGKPTVSLQIYHGGIYCGMIETRSGTIEAYAANFGPLGDFENLDDATVAVMAATDHARQA